ncbi:hypothetical protein SD80_014000 [Scytonema tolypothrichoides VB-61278]|nr:hypothetical protein SD80_014000 [Scytonema tolypothrichoides VB-61278]
MKPKTPMMHSNLQQRISVQRPHRVTRYRLARLVLLGLITFVLSGVPPMMATESKPTSEADFSPVMLGSNTTSETRDPAYWPFDAHSPWNMPIGSEAQFEPVSSPEWTTQALKYGLQINTTNWSIPIFMAKPSDPMRNIYSTDYNKLAFEEHVPDVAVPDSSEDGHLHIIDETHNYVIEMLWAKRRADYDLEAPYPNKIDLKGLGVFDTYHGSCAYGGSCTAGLIRKGELQNGIRHALRISITPAVLNKNTPSGKPYVWPANWADDDGKGSSYTGTGNVYMGSLLAIPTDVNIEAIVGPPGTPIYELARALQDYGAYVVDRGHLNLYAEPSADEEVSQLSWEGLQVLPKYLLVVANNGSERVGGGGTPRRPLAPPFAVVDGAES